jgi:hypothetical protein
MIMLRSIPSIPAYRGSTEVEVVLLNLPVEEEEEEPLLLLIPPITF